MKNSPPKPVLSAFGCTTDAMPLTGGQGTTWRSGDIVLKPMFDAEGAIWESEALISLPRKGYRIAEPVRAVDGRWTCEGWTAARFVSGQSPNGSLVAERLAASRALHRDLLGFERPSHFDQATDPWSLADRIAFGLEPWTPHPRIANCLDRFKNSTGHVEGPWQIIHGDLAGNFLFADDHPPAIIDFTPKWSPQGFGEAVLAVDVFLWEGVPWETITCLLTPQELLLLPRASARRLLEVDTHHRIHKRPDSVFDQVTAYERLADMIETLR